MITSEKINYFFDAGSAIRRMFEEGLELKAKYGADAVADLSIGNPEFEPPPGFRNALQAMASADGRHAYMPNAGFQDVRRRVAYWLRKNGFFADVDPDHVIMTTGAAGALNVVFKTILNPGDVVLVPRPYFVEYRFYIDNHGGEMRLVDTQADFELDIGQIADAIDARTRAVVVTSPHNPTGRVYRRDTLLELAALLTDRSRRYGEPIFLISDEPYRDILYGDDAYISPATLYPNSFMCYSWSKSFSIAGERIGYLVIHPAMETESMPRLVGSLAMCNRILGFVNAPAFMQRVIAACIDEKPDITHYVAKRYLICNALREAGYHFAEPDGGFYVFPRCPGGDERFLELAREHLLLVVPGSAFGCPGYFRLSFACPMSTLRLACRKLSELATIGRT